MSKIVAIGTATPAYRHRQQDILNFMLEAYKPEAGDRRKISLLYERSGIDTRYSVIPDYSVPVSAREFYPKNSELEPFPTLEHRMDLYMRHATELSVAAIKNCVDDEELKNITWLITVSCTGLSAPGLDIDIMNRLKLSPDIHRSSVNFMGCYAAVHALKMADTICRASEKEKVLIVCTELCTIHFQKDGDMDSVSSGLLFADGAAATLVAGDTYPARGLSLTNFYSQVALQGHDDMAWNLSGRGFLMKLSAYIPQLLREGIAPLLSKALNAAGNKKEEINHWAIHPGGRKILETIETALGLSSSDLQYSYDVLRNYGNMSSPTILFVLEKIMRQQPGSGQKIFAAAFGPGLTMETIVLENE